MSAVTTRSVEGVYERYATYYDFLFGAVFHPGRKSAIEILQCGSGDRVLEVGVGTGLSLSLYSPDVRVVGIDLSREMLDRARSKKHRLGLNHVEDLIQMDAQRMSFPDNSFDKVVAMYVATVVPDMVLFMQEIRRVCKPGGRIILLNHFQNKNPVIRRLEAAIQPMAKYLGFHPDFPIEKFLQKTGFVPEISIPVNVFDYWTILVGKNDKAALTSGN